VTIVGRNAPPGLLGQAKYREGFARLAPLGLSYDAWLFHTQLGELVELAQSFPETTIVLNHCGGPIGVGSYAARRQEVVELWRRGIGALAKCGNVYVKVGGLGTAVIGFDVYDRRIPASSEELALAWRVYIEPCIQTFGPNRCMFESNFPVDKRSFSYAVMWNAFKRLAEPYSAEERRALFAGTAATAYRLNLEEVKGRI
jgi:predicted TIM-barrel fold metal-dependent hydrolase